MSLDESDNDSNDETESENEIDNDESNEQFVESYNYFNKNKNLIVNVNHALLGFYLCQSVCLDDIDVKYYGFNSV